MKKFNPELLESKAGRLDALIFKNSYLNIPETLFYKIQIDLKEFFFENRSIETSLILDFVRFDISKIKELENKVFEYPINPVEGYIDGSIYLFGAHNPFDVSKIEFKKWNNGSIDTILHYDIDFEFENTGYSKITDCKLNTSLLLGLLSIDPDVQATEDFNSGDLKKI